MLLGAVFFPAAKSWTGWLPVHKVLICYEATQDYSSHAIVRFLESIGASFGACQNAITSTDETIYELLIPTDDPKFLTTAFSVLAQFAAKIRYNFRAAAGIYLLRWPGCLPLCVLHMRMRSVSALTALGHRL